MVDSDSSQLILLLVCIVLSSFFSSAETALTSLGEIKLRSMLSSNVKNAKLVQKVLNEPAKLLSAILIGNNLVNIGASALSTVLATKYFGSNGVGIATGVLTFIILVFGEITPKTFAKQNNVSVSSFTVKPIYFCMVVFTPIIALLNVITGGILKLLKSENPKNNGFTEDEFLTMVDYGHEEGILENEEREMINNVVDFGESDAKEVMVPRIDMVAVPVDMSYSEVAEVFRKNRFARLPVYEETNDHIVGVLSFKDIMFEENTEKFKIENYMREPYFTYESKPCSSLFSVMKKQKISMAIVLDEYGGTAGIVTLQDLIEEIVGDIIDDDREDSEDIIRLKENEYCVKGTARLDDLNELMGSDLEFEDVDSVGGYITGKLGYFPEKGETFTYEGLCFTVLEVGKNRIDMLKIAPEQVNEESLENINATEQ